MEIARDLSDEEQFDHFKRVFADDARGYLDRGITFGDTRPSESRNKNTKKALEWPLRPYGPSDMLRCVKMTSEYRSFCFGKQTDRSDCIAHFSLIHSLGRLRRLCPKLERCSLIHQWCP